MGLTTQGRPMSVTALTYSSLVCANSIRAGFQPQFFRRQATNALAVHGQLRGSGGGNDGKALALQFGQRGGGNGLDFRHDQVGLFQFDHPAQRLAVEHVDHMGAMRDLHGGGVGVAVHRDHFDAEALQLDGDFLAEFTRAAQQHFFWRWG